MAAIPKTVCNSILKVKKKYSRWRGNDDVMESKRLQSIIGFSIGKIWREKILLVPDPFLERNEQIQSGQLSWQHVRLVLGKFRVQILPSLIELLIRERLGERFYAICHKIRLHRIKFKRFLQSNPKEYRSLDRLVCRAQLSL